MDDREGEAAIASDRARELLEASSDSVGSELDHAEGWLREADLARRSGYWQVEVAVGALGALANAWGRMSLWARAMGVEDSVRDDLEWVMSELVDLFKSLTHHAPTSGELERLQTVVDRARAIHARVTKSF